MSNGDDPALTTPEVLTHVVKQVSPIFSELTLIISPIYSGSTAHLAM
jgi:hypothetical protein